MTLKDLLNRKVYNRRFIELDLIRGFAILFMIVLHVLWDFDYFGLYQLNGEVYQVNIAVPTLFFILAGICLTVSTNKAPLNSKKAKHLLTRGLWILFLGSIFTLITMAFIPDRPIFFGVLHCIGCCIILSIPFIKIRLQPMYTFIIGLTIICTGYILNLFPMQNPSLLHFAIGFHQGNVGAYTIDYFPLIPWFGVCLLGMAFGDVLYKNHQRQFTIPDLSRYRPVNLLSWMGQHSLLLYLIHQPVIAGVISAYLLL